MEVNKQLNVPQHENTLCCCQGQTKPIVVWVDISSGGARHSLSRIANVECLLSGLPRVLMVTWTVNIIVFQFQFYLYNSGMILSFSIVELWSVLSIWLSFDYLDIRQICNQIKNWYLHVCPRDYFMLIVKSGLLWPGPAPDMKRINQFQINQVICLINKLTNDYIRII